MDITKVLACNALSARIASAKLDSSSHTQVRKQASENGQGRGRLLVQLVVEDLLFRLQVVGESKQARHLAELSSRAQPHVCNCYLSIISCLYRHLVGK